MKQINPIREEEKKDFSEAIDKVFEKIDNRYADFIAKQEAEKEAKIASGQYIEVNGKIFDARYYKG